MKKRNKREVHLFRVWQGNDVDKNALYYAESPDDAFRQYLSENDIFLMDDESSIHVMDLGEMKDPDDR